MSARSDVLLWAQRVAARKGAEPHVLLEIPAGAELAIAQAAFHKIARMAHPDLHRTTLSADELELVTSAYGQVAAAYQELRTQATRTARSKPITRAPGATTPPPAGPDGAAVGDPPKPAMSSKALVQYRKAELALRRGELKTALLHLKMAIAADPQSASLRTALAEVEAEVSKNS